MMEKEKDLGDLGTWKELRDGKMTDKRSTYSSGEGVLGNEVWGRDEATTQRPRMLYNSLGPHDLHHCNGTYNPKVRGMRSWVLWEQKLRPSPLLAERA